MHLISIDVKTKYSVVPSLSQILNVDKQNRNHPFWIMLTDITPGPNIWCDEDVFLIPLQIEMECLNNDVFPLIDRILIYGGIDFLLTTRSF